MYMHPSLKLLVVLFLGGQMASCKPRFLICFEAWLLQRLVTSRFFFS